VRQVAALPESRVQQQQPVHGGERRIDLFRRTTRPEADAIEVIIGPRATFSGTLQCDASIRIDGSVDQGRIVTPANVILTETAVAQCDIIAKTVSIRGQFNGVIQADRVEMLDGSQVQGVLNVNSFYMDERAVLRAAVNIRGDAAGPAPRPQPPQQPSIPVAHAQPGAEEK
jgi:cytoskeletal protein CcmA (bactofilin family)